MAGALALPLMCGQVLAAEGDAFYRGGYVAPMASFISPGDDRLDSGFGGTIGFGYRWQHYALELAGYQLGMDGAGGGSVDLAGGAVNGLWFPFESLPNLYGIASLGGASMSDYPLARLQTNNPNNSASFSQLRLGGGLGYLMPLSMGRYEFGLRGEALYVHGYRHEQVSEFEDIDAPRNFDDLLFNLGLQFPFGFKAPAAPAPEPVKVVETVAACADGADNDGDGIVDFPADPGCQSADDEDEVDPPQCSDGKDNDGDGLTDYPEDAAGCASADDNDESDPCKEPGPGERVSLRGCGTGDAIVLRGVNFDFDRATLTTDARAILDNVAEELNAYPDLEVELSGHTDSRGSDAYNQDLSDRRAASVRRYLGEQGVAISRLTAVGFGETRPVADNDSDDGRERNRRVELKVTAGVAADGSNSGPSRRVSSGGADIDDSIYDTGELGATPPAADAGEGESGDATPGE